MKVEFQKMSRQGAWGRVLSNFWKYVRNDFSKKNYIAEDAHGNKFYELTNSRQNVGRGFEPPMKGQQIEPDIEWQAWLRGTRRFPPSDQEIALNRMKQQAQLAQDTTTEKRAPFVHSEGMGSGDHKPQKYPKYKDLEVTPGFREKDQK